MSAGLLKGHLHVDSKRIYLLAPTIEYGPVAGSYPCALVLMLSDAHVYYVKVSKHQIMQLLKKTVRQSVRLWCLRKHVACFNTHSHHDLHSLCCWYRCVRVPARCVQVALLQPAKRYHTLWAGRPHQPRVHVSKERGRTVLSALRVKWGS